MTDTTITATAAQGGVLASIAPIGLAFAILVALALLFVLFAPVYDSDR
jgi:hypothetical protein